MDLYDDADGQDSEVNAVAEVIMMHVTETVAPVTSLFSDESDGALPIDVAVVESDEDRDFHLLVTAGMSARAQEMPGDDGPEDLYTELVMLLPKEWLLDLEAMDDLRHYWPFQWIREIANFPHEEDAFICPGQTIQVLDEPMFKELGTNFTGMLLYVPSSFDEAFNSLDLESGETIHFVSCIPLYPEELDFADKNGMEALVDLLVESGISEVIDIARPSVVP